jgi:hypothetical protein
MKPTFERNSKVIATCPEHFGKAGIVDTVLPIQHGNQIIGYDYLVNLREKFEHKFTWRTEKLSEHQLEHLKE